MIRYYMPTSCFFRLSALFTCHLARHVFHALIRRSAKREELLVRCAAERAVAHAPRRMRIVAQRYKDEMRADSITGAYGCQAERC